MKPRRAIAGLVILGVTIHGFAVGAVYWKTGRIDSFAFQSLDGGEYYGIARNLLQYGAFSTNESPPLTPDTWRTPGYPMFLAGAMLLVGSSPTALILLQQMLAVVSAVLLFLIARRHISAERAFFASALLLIEPYGVYYSFWFLSATWFTALLLAVWWSFDRAIAESRASWFAAAGLLCGLLVLTWPGALLIPLALAALAWIRNQATLIEERRSGQNRRGARIRGIAALLLCCGMVVGSWMIRNRIVGGHWALSHQSGIVMAYFKGTEVELWRQGRTQDRYVETSLNPANELWPHTVWDEIDAQLRDRMSNAGARGDSELSWRNLAQGNKTSYDSFALSAALGGIGVEMMARSPSDTVLCGLTRIGENLAFPLGLAIEKPANVEANRGRSAAIGGAYTLLTIGALFGFIRNRRLGVVVYLPAACVLALALTTTPQVDPRFRVPMIPMLLFLMVCSPRVTIEASHSSGDSSS